MDSDQAIVAVFIDYDNLLPSHKAAGLASVVARALTPLKFRSEVNRGNCDVRVYGGWYEGSQMTRAAQDLSVEIQKEFPLTLRLPSGQDKHIAMTVNAELAVALLQEPGHHLLNTYRRKGRPSNIRVADPTEVGCTDAVCLLPLVRQLLKSGKCPKTSCGITSTDLVYRSEQKIVDTMLACDLVHAANVSPEWIVLVSGDDDFLPPLRTVLLRGAPAARFHTKPYLQGAGFPAGGAILVELEL